MPPRRQLPWATKSSNNKSHVKPPPAKRTIPSDIDDDFFDGTVLESSRKGKERADVEDSDGELPELPSKFAPKTRKDQDSSRDARMPSSSPPPIAADLPLPETEFMLTGVDKFDLRDDEWMMVEDELLQTAKLFTQHLHLAEYETMKTKMDELRKAAATRPVIANAKPSVEGRFKRQAQEQANKQKKAIKEVFSTRDRESEGDEEPQRTAPSRPTSYLPPARPLSTAKALSTSKPSHASRHVSNESASDSDDLDAPTRPPTTKPSVVPSKPPAAQAPAKEPEPFIKPAIPTKTQPKPARGQRRNLWDDWDELAANPRPSIPASPPSRAPHQASSPTKTVGLSTKQQSSSPAKTLHTFIPKRTENGTPTPSKRFTTSVDDDDLNTPKRTPLAKDKPDRPAKRKAENDRSDKKKQKYDDIPTFLF